MRKFWEMKHSLIIIQKNDFKSQAWAQAARQQNLGKIIPVSGSPMNMPFVLLSYILRFKKPLAVVFRYLNDYPFLFRTLLRTTTELLTVFIAKVSKIRILWICHNVDKETSSYHPRLTFIRRKILKKYSKRIFVMDPLLIPYGTQKLNVSDKKIDSLSFGRTDIFLDEDKHNSCLNEELKNKLSQWPYFEKKQKGEARIGLWIGNLVEKKMEGLKFFLRTLLQNGKDSGEIAFLIIGPIEEKLYNNDPKLYNTLKNSNKVLFINKYIDVPANLWNHLADFVWKPNDDISVTLTAYNSALAKLPLVVFHNSFLGKFVEHYKLGFTINPETFSLKEFTYTLKEWNPYHASLFLEKKTWNNGARKLFQLQQTIE